MKDKLTLDASGQYRRDLGWKPGRNGGYTQQRFYLGRDLERAKRLVRKLEVLWDDIVARYERSPGMDSEGRAAWTANTLAMARGIIADAKTVFVRPPEIVRGDDRALDTELLGVWFERMVRDFRGMNLTLDHPTLKGEIGTLADAYQAKATRLRPANKSRETLHEALDAYKEWLGTKKYLTPPEAGKERRASQSGVKEAERVERLKRHVENLPLSDLGVRQIEDVVTYWSNRPESSLGAAFAVTVCRHHVRCWKSFLRWLHKEPAFGWKQPPDLLWGRERILVHQHEIDARIRPQQVETYSKEELRVLWVYATEPTRILMALALNCGFGIAEIGSLKREQVADGFVRRLRTKTAVYGEWKLWPVTQELLTRVGPNGTPWLLVTRKGKQLIEASKGNFRGQYIPNRWSRLLDRVRKDHPEFRRLSVNKLRKTAGTLIREVAGGEIAGIFLAHGRAVKTDDLAEVYTNRPFPQVWAAQDKVWEQLKDIFVGDAVTEAKISVGTVRQIQAMHAGGATVDEIVTACGVSKTTVRNRLRGRTEKKQSPQPSE